MLYYHHAWLFNRIRLQQHGFSQFSKYVNRKMCACIDTSNFVLVKELSYVVLEGAKILSKW